MLLMLALRNTLFPNQIDIGREKKIENVMKGTYKEFGAKQ